MLSAADRRIDGQVDEASRVIGDVILEKGAKVENSELRGPMIIGENTVVRDSYVGPFTSISSGCEIVGAEIEFSIILENCRIHELGRRLEASLIGRNVEITHSSSKPVAYRFMVGDNSEIQVPG